MSNFSDQNKKQLLSVLANLEKQTNDMEMIYNSKLSVICQGSYRCSISIKSDGKINYKLLEKINDSWEIIPGSDTYSFIVFDHQVTCLINRDLAKRSKSQL